MKCDKCKQCQLALGISYWRGGLERKCARKTNIEQNVTIRLGARIIRISTQILGLCWRNADIDCGEVKLATLTEFRIIHFGLFVCLWEMGWLNSSPNSMSVFVENVEIFGIDWFGKESFRPNFLKRICSFSWVWWLRWPTTTISIGKLNRSLFTFPMGFPALPLNHLLPLPKPLASSGLASISPLGRQHEIASNWTFPRSYLRFVCPPV